MVAIIEHLTKKECTQLVTHLTHTGQLQYNKHGRNKLNPKFSIFLLVLLCMLTLNLEYNNGIFHQMQLHYTAIRLYSALQIGKVRVLNNAIEIMHFLAMDY